MNMAHLYLKVSISASSGSTNQIHNSNAETDKLLFHKVAGVHPFNDNFATFWKSDTKPLDQLDSYKARDSLP